MNHLSPALRRIATTFALTIVSVSANALLVPPAGAATPRVLAIRVGPDLEH